MVLAFCDFLMTLYYCIKFHLIPLFTFRGTLRTGFLLQKIKKACNCVNILFYRVMIRAFCTFSAVPLSMFKFSFNLLVYFQSSAPDKLFISKIKKESNSLNTTDRVTILALWTFADGLLKCIKFHFIPLYTFRDMIRTNFLLQNRKKGSNSVNTVDRVMVLKLRSFADGSLSMCQSSFTSLIYFQRYAPEKLFIAKNKKGSNSVNTVDRVTIHAFCTFFGFPCILSEMCSGQTSYCKMKKESNSVNTIDRVMISALCNFPHGPLSVYNVSLIYPQYF